MAIVISFQSKDVLDIVKNEGIYIPDITKCREHRSYEADGGPKVWVFEFEDMSFNGFSTGIYFERCRCEMSLNQSSGLSKFVMFELHVDESRLSIGKTHNSSKYAKVMDELYLKDIAAIYHIDSTEHWYFKKAVLDEKFTKEDILFPDNINTFTWQIWKKYQKKNNVKSTNLCKMTLEAKYGITDFDELMHKVWKEEMPEYEVESED